MALYFEATPWAVSAMEFMRANGGYAWKALARCRPHNSAISFLFILSLTCAKLVL